MNQQWASQDLGGYVEKLDCREVGLSVVAEMFDVSATGGRVLVGYYAFQSIGLRIIHEFRRDMTPEVREIGLKITELWG